MKGIVAFVVFLILPSKGNSASLSVLSENLEWKAWMNVHGRSYNNGVEESFRRAVWMQNLKKIERNRKSDSGFAMATNNLADLTEAEYRSLMLGKKSRGKKAVMDGTAHMRANDTRLPESVDWRTTGCVTPVETQMAGGRSWAVSAVGSLEGQYCIPRGQTVSLSEQKLSNCCSGCFAVDDAFRYIIAHNHIEFESNYDNNCNFSAAAYGASLTGYVDIPHGSEYQLQFATAKVGPISVAIDASHQSFQLYRGGVYNEPSCSSTQLDHAVLVVGYGSVHGNDYWLVKNSWGVAWGMNGYILMSRNKDNQCGIATSASYPTGVDITHLWNHWEKRLEN